MGYKILFLPNWSNKNPYLRILASELTDLGHQVLLEDFPSGYLPLNKIISAHKETKIVHLHWINSLIRSIAWSENRAKQEIKLLILGLDILICRLRGVKIFWTIHNLISHESRDIAGEIKARRIIAFFCSKILVHSQSALKLIEETYGITLYDKSVVIPHCNFDGIYKSSFEDTEKLKEKFGLTPNNIVILFFGLIRKYKGLEKLIDAFRAVDDPRLRLIIAGNPEEMEYGKSICEATKFDTRIITNLGFIPDQDVGNFYALSNIVALPFERTLTSGSAILAFTMGKALLLPVEARVLDFVNENNSLFFASREELISILQNLEKTQLMKMGLLGRETINIFDKRTIAEKINSTYQQSNI